MAWCETNRVDFVFGLARNARLTAEIEAELLAAEAEADAAVQGLPLRHARQLVALAPGDRQGRFNDLSPRETRMEWRHATRARRT
jgi:hypothetical protein